MLKRTQFTEVCGSLRNRGVRQYSYKRSLCVCSPSLLLATSWNRTGRGGRIMRRRWTCLEALLCSSDVHGCPSTHASSPVPRKVYLVIQLKYTDGRRYLSSRSLAHSPSVQTCRFLPTHYIRVSLPHPRTLDCFLSGRGGVANWKEEISGSGEGNKIYFLRRELPTSFFIPVFSRFFSAAKS